MVSAYFVRFQDEMNVENINTDPKHQIFKSHCGHITQLMFPPRFLLCLFFRNQNALLSIGTTQKQIFNNPSVSETATTTTKIAHYRQALDENYPLNANFVLFYRERTHIET